MSGLQLKTVLNDSTSGGTDVVPYWFDDMAITFPLLHSELLPYIDLRDVPFGTTTKGGSIGNPTLTWGSSEGTAFTEFVTTNLIGAFNQTIYPVVIGLELGIDFLSDSPMAVGAIVQQNIGQASLKELDNVIANGNGSSQPQGLFNASGTVAVSSINGTGGPFQVEDAEDLMFGIGKQYRAKPWNIAYVMNDTSYQRLRAVPVGPADARRVFGIDEQSYQLLGYPVRIQNGITNNQAALVALKKFILYRRRGWDLRTVTEGKTLALSNTVLYVGRGRFGGALSDGAAMAVMTNAPN
jgi:HK97 family phage major capsid protein